MAVDPLAQFFAKSSDRILEPMDRISEVLFGLIMALTFTLTLGVVSADSIQVRTMLLGALGCNLAWGIIELTDEQLEQRIRDLDAAIARELGTAARTSGADGGTAPSGTRH